MDRKTLVRGFALLLVTLTAVAASAMPVLATTEEDMSGLSDTILTLLIAIIPIIIIIAVFGLLMKKMKFGALIPLFAFVGLGLNTVNESAFEGLTDTILTLLVAIIPIVIIIGVFTLIMKKMKFGGS